MADVEDRLRSCFAERGNAFVPLPLDLHTITRQGRLHRARRFAAVGGAGVIVIGVTALLTVGMHTVATRPRHAAPAAGQNPAADLALSITHLSDDQTCAVVTFPQTGDSLTVSCSHLSTDDASKSGVISEAVTDLRRVHADAPASTVVYGLLPLGGGSVTVMDEIGSETSAALLAVKGYPYEVFVADLGNHRAQTVSYHPARGHSSTERVPSPAPSAP